MPDVVLIADAEEPVLVSISVGVGVWTIREVLWIVRHSGDIIHSFANLEHRVFENTSFFASIFLCPLIDTELHIAWSENKPNGLLHLLNSERDLLPSCFLDLSDTLEGVETVVLEHLAWLIELVHWEVEGNQVLLKFGFAGMNLECRISLSLEGQLVSIYWVLTAVVSTVVEVPGALFTY